MSSVVVRKAAAALALARAISGVTHSAPSMRWHATRCPASSTTAMATRNPRSCAFASPRAMHSRAAVKVMMLEPPKRERVSWHLHEDLLAVDAYRVRRDRCAPCGKRARARADVEHPAVPGAGESCSAELALAQRTAPVGADVAARVHGFTRPREY